MADLWMRIFLSAAGALFVVGGACGAVGFPANVPKWADRAFNVCWPTAILCMFAAMLVAMWGDL